MKNFPVAVLVICAMLWGSAYGQQGQKKSANDSTEWKAVADRFMSELVGNRIDKALDLMEPEFMDGCSRWKADGQGSNRRVIRILRTAAG
jgi:hypothetical protein